MNYNLRIKIKLVYIKMQQVITLSYNDIITGKKCNEEIENAFGQDGLGIIIIKDLPDFQKERIKVFQWGSNR